MVFKSRLNHFKELLLFSRPERGTEGAREQMLLDFVGSEETRGLETLGMFSTEEPES